MKDMGHLALSVLLCALLLGGGLTCHAQELPSGDLRPQKTETLSEPERDTSSLTSTPVLPPSMFGMSAILRYSGMNRLPVPAGPMTAFDVYNMQLTKISGGLYPSMQRNFTATMWTPTPGEMVFSAVASLFLTPYASVPYGYWAFNPSFPFASLTKIPDYRDYANMYSPDLIPQYIRAVRDEKTGIYMQEAVPVEQINTSGWHLGGTNTAPLNLGPMNPVEREVQRINGGRSF